MRIPSNIVLAVLLAAALGGCVIVGAGPMPVPGPAQTGGTGPIPVYGGGWPAPGLPGKWLAYPHGSNRCANFRKYKPDCTPRNGGSSQGTANSGDKNQGDGGSGAPSSASSAS